MEDDIEDSGIEETQGREVSDEEIDSDEEQQRSFSTHHHNTQLRGHILYF